MKNRKSLPVAYDAIRSIDDGGYIINEIDVVIEDFQNKTGKLQSLQTIPLLVA